MLESLNSKKYSDVYDDYDMGSTRKKNIHRTFGAGMLAGGAYLAPHHPKTATALGLLGVGKIAFPTPLFYKYHKNQYEKEKANVNGLKKNPEESSSN
jgi:hypothetical protein